MNCELLTIRIWIRSEARHRHKQYAVDSESNLYTTETWEGKRLQKFVNRGLAPVTSPHQLTVWPKG